METQRFDQDYYDANQLADDRIALWWYARVLRRPPTAVFAASDVQAFGVMEAAARAGVDVPDDLSVVGFDDIELAGAIGLTTVRQPLRESGRRGAALLLRALEGDGGGRGGELPGLALVERRTVRRLPRARAVKV